MNRLLLKHLSEFGFNAVEARVYLALLDLGEGSVLEISKKSGMNRTTIYPILDALKHRGLAFETKVGKHTRYVPERPQEFLKRLQARIGRLAGEIEQLPPKAATHRPHVYFFEGSDGFKQVWQALFRSGVKEYLIMTDAREMLGFVRERYIVDWIIKEKVRLGIRSRQLIAASASAKDIVAKDSRENRVSKILPHIYKTPVTTIIFGENVAFITPATENLILMVVESPSFAKTQRALFETIWDLLPSPGSVVRNAFPNRA